MKDKDAEIADLRATIEELRALLESETLCKVDYQNNLQSLNEELSFRKKVYEEVSRFLLKYKQLGAGASLTFPGDSGYAVEVGPHHLL